MLLTLKDIIPMYVWRLVEGTNRKTFIFFFLVIFIKLSFYPLLILV